MTQHATDIAAYEGLIFTTAARYAPILDDDFEDVQQILRVKVWRSLEAYDARRSKLPVERYVFSCVYNQVKDLLKSQDRRNERRGGHLDSIDAVPDERRSSFESDYLSQSAEDAFARVEDEPLPLPSTLTESERDVVALLVADFSQAEIALRLGLSRKKVRSTHASVMEKMADWRPGSGPPLVTELGIAA